MYEYFVKAMRNKITTRQTNVSTCKFAETEIFVEKNN